MNKTIENIPEFDKKFRYDGKDLGASVTGGETRFKVWSPLAEKIELRLYADPQGPARECHPLTRGNNGTWEVKLPKALYGTFYDYLVWHDGKAVPTADPYALSCCCNGSRSMVVNLKATDPENFENDCAPAPQPETVIYELHVKDFSYDPESGVPAEFRGKYKAFTVKDARCIRHMKELGITHVHLLPFYDYGSVDEAGPDSQFNWGYDPVNYNVPEGSYATNASDGYTRIRECKEMIQTLHENGIRVIMDVVYNHTYSADSWFGRMVPGYYYRSNPDGTLADGSACGNDVAVGRAMVDNYIADSVLYWAKEFHLDGFRFDLMGLLTVELMNRIRRELDEAFGPNEKLLYGEPWRAAPSPMEEGTKAALKENVQELSQGVAVFSDNTRDTIKGHVFYAEETGFVSGREGLEKDILKAVTGWTEGTEGFHPLSCAQVVNYVSAHDNFTLWDKLVLSMHPALFEKKYSKEAVFTARYPDVVDAYKLAAFIYMTCQGHLFMQAGEEFGRTKLGDENSFMSSPEINMLSWRQAEDNRDLVRYYKGLIALRKNMPGLRDKTPGAAERITNKTVHGPGILSFRVDNGKDSAWPELFILYNAGDKAYPLTLPAGGWVILADKEEANCRKHAGSTITAPAHGGLMLGRKAEGK